MAELIAILCSIGAAAILGLVHVCHGSMSLNDLLYRVSRESDRVRCDEIHGVIYMGDDLGAPRRGAVRRRYVIFTEEVGDEDNVMEIYPGAGHVGVPGFYRVRRRINGEYLEFSTYSEDDLRSFLRREDLISRLPARTEYRQAAV